jgi:hypothetical protein
MSQIDRMDLFGGLKTADDWKDEMADAFGALAGIDYGAEGDDVDDDLDALESEMFGEDADETALTVNRAAQARAVASQLDIQGQLTVPGGMREIVNDLEGVFAADVVLPEVLDDGYTESMVEFVSEHLANDDDTREMATYLANFIQQGGKPWSALPAGVKMGMVKAAVQEAAKPGMELGFDDRIYDVFKAIQNGDYMDAMAAAAMVPVEGLQDSARAALDIVDMIKLPYIGDALTPAFAEVADEQINTLAVFYVVLDTMGFPVYDWLTQEVDEDMGEIVPPGASQEFDLGPDVDTGAPSEISEYVRTDFIFEAAPPSAEGIRPQDVLAIGYAAITAGALTGFIK